MKNKYVFDTTEYQFAHQKKPQGIGCWAFSIDDQQEDWISSEMTFSEAKKSFIKMADSVVQTWKIPDGRSLIIKVRS